MKTTVDLIVTVNYVRNLVEPDGSCKIAIPEYIYGNDKEAENKLVITFATTLDTIPRNLGFVLDSSDKNDSVMLRQLMEIAMVEHFPDEMVNKTMRIIAEDTPGKLIPLVVGFTNIDKCYILGKDLPLRKFSLAKMQVENE
ncbi:MAG: hypothetical protein HFJ45_07090 [Clostridia bacterium]|nr:hypothetical protein [Clostridia bacterium]